MLSLDTYHLPSSSVDKPNKSNKIALVAGGTGLVGRELIQSLSARDDIQKIIILTRKPAVFSNAKVNAEVVDFDAPGSLNYYADEVYCCLGTTIKVAGSRSKFKRVDLDYPLKLARETRAKGSKVFMVISAMGANPKSFVFYNRVKGEMEQSVNAIDFDSVGIFRPSLLLGDRDEFRLAEKAAILASPVLKMILPANYKPVSAAQVAQSMSRFGFEAKLGNAIISNREILSGSK